MQPTHETRQVRVHLPLDLHRQVRHLAVDAGLPIAAIVEALVREALARRP